MPNLVERSNNIASTLSVPSDVFRVNEGYPILLASKKKNMRETDGSPVDCNGPTVIGKDITARGIDHCLHTNGLVGNIT